MQREKMAQGGPQAGLVQLINCFCSALGVSLNIHQPVMKESSELPLNIDGPGLAGCLLLALPSAPERLPHWEEPLGFPRKNPICPAMWASPKETPMLPHMLRGVWDRLVSLGRDGWWSITAAIHTSTHSHCTNLHSQKLPSILLPPSQATQTHMGQTRARTSHG